MELGKEYEIDITETIPNGEGIGRVKGFQVCVPQAQVGDHLTVKITRVDSVSADARKVT